MSERSKAAVATLMRADPQFVEMCKMLYGPGVDADVVWADITKMNPGPSDVSIPGGPAHQRRRKALALTALGTTGAGAAVAVRDLRRVTGRRRLLPAAALAGDVLAGGELYSHLKTIVGSNKQPVGKASGHDPACRCSRCVASRPHDPSCRCATCRARRVSKVSLSTLVRGSLTQHRRLVRATLDATRLPAQTAANYVDRGAPKAVGKRATVEADWTGTFAKVNDDKRLALGWASICKINGAPVVDRQMDYVDAEDLEDAVYRYVERSRVGGDMHDRVSKNAASLSFRLLTPADEPRHVADLVESVIFTKAKKEALGLPEDFPEGWWVGFRYHDDEVWDAIKKGERRGFSIHGSGLRKSVDYDQLMTGGH